MSHSNPANADPDMELEFNHPRHITITEDELDVSAPQEQILLGIGEVYTDQLTVTLPFTKDTLEQVQVFVELARQKSRKMVRQESSEKLPDYRRPDAYEQLSTDLEQVDEGQVTLTGSQIETLWSATSVINEDYSAFSKIDAWQNLKRVLTCVDVQVSAELVR